MVSGLFFMTVRRERELILQRLSNSIASQRMLPFWSLRRRAELGRSIRAHRIELKKIDNRIAWYGK